MYVLRRTFVVPVTLVACVGTISSMEESKRPLRIRRANTNISTMDSVVVGYEYRLRENSSLEKNFKYFSSVVINGESYMTPLDLVRAITPGVPPSPNSTPLNIPLADKSSEELRTFSSHEIPDFFRFGGFSNGLIDYQLFLVLVTLHAIPHAELPVAFGMCAGNDFSNTKFRGNGLNVHNFDFIMQRNIKIRGQGYETDHQEGDIVYKLFGSNLNKELSFDEFKEFHQTLRDEVVKLQYYLLSDLTTTEKDGVSMSLPGFARSVAALVPSDYRNSFITRADELKLKRVPDLVIEQEIRRNPGLVPDTTVGLQLTVSLEEYIIWHEVLRSLGDMEQAVRYYSYEDGHFSRTNINRAASAVAKVKLSRAQIWSIFELFDPDNTNVLKHEGFVRLLLPHSMASDPRNEDEGLGLFSLAECVGVSCKMCYRNWYHGTTVLKK